MAELVIGGFVARSGEVKKDVEVEVGLRLRLS